MSDISLEEFVAAILFEAVVLAANLSAFTGEVNWESGNAIGVWIAPVRGGSLDYRAGVVLFLFETTIFFEAVVLAANLSAVTCEVNWETSDTVRIWVAPIRCRSFNNWTGSVCLFNDRILFEAAIFFEAVVFTAYLPTITSVIDRESSNAVGIRVTPERR